MCLINAPIAQKVGFIALAARPAWCNLMRMFRGKDSIFKRLALLALLLCFTQPSAAAEKRDLALERQLMAHITALASDEFEGRQPGTEGEAKTLRYIGEQWFALGLVSGTNDPGSEWFAPVKVIERQPANSSAKFTRRDRPQYTPSDAVLILTSGQRSLVRNAPLLFVGLAKGAMPPRSDLAGRVAVLLDGGIENSERQNALLTAGASAVLTVLDAERTLSNVKSRRLRPGYALASDTLGGDLEGFITRAGLTNLLQGSGFQLAGLEAAAAKPDFAPVLLGLNATLEATTREVTIRTHNLIGKLPGKKPGSGAVLFLAHWDHFGICGVPPAEELICRGAVDNASGLAALTEIARRIVRGPKLDRDVYFLATTAEELGLLGAHAFAENPPIPLKQFVAAFNLDTVALAPAGSPVAIIGKGMTRLDDHIAAVLRREKRAVVPGDAANAYVRRQDGWALMQHDVPTVMVSSAYADVPRLEAFFEGPYHRPADNLQRTIELGGAAQDVALHVALARWFGDAKRVRAEGK
jgi:Peptidase family M28